MVRQRLPWLVATTNPARSGKAVGDSNSGVELGDVALNTTTLHKTDEAKSWVDNPGLGITVTPPTGVGALESTHDACAQSDDTSQSPWSFKVNDSSRVT